MKVMQLFLVVFCMSALSSSVMAEEVSGGEGQPGQVAHFSFKKLKQGAEKVANDVAKGAEHLVNEADKVARSVEDELKKDGGKSFKVDLSAGKRWIEEGKKYFSKMVPRWREGVKRAAVRVGDAVEDVLESPQLTRTQAWLGQTFEGRVELKEAEDKEHVVTSCSEDAQGCSSDALGAQVSEKDKLKEEARLSFADWCESILIKYWSGEESEEAAAILVYADWSGDFD